MNRMLAVLFDELSHALDARDALKSLTREDDDTALRAYAIVTRKADGRIGVSEQHKRPLEHRTLAGDSITSLITMLNRPAGVPAEEDRIAGVKVDVDDLRVAADFVGEVSGALTPGRVALLAEVDEEWTPWINLRMQELAGTVYRCPFSDVKEAANLQKIATMQADLARLKAEHARASADRKAKLYAKINALDSTIQQHLERDKNRREAAAAEAQNRANSLTKKAAQAAGGNKNRTSQ